MKPRTYVRRGVWHLDKGRKKQDSGFLDLLAKPLFTTLASVAGPPLLNFATKKVFGRGKNRKRRKRRRRRY